LLAVARLATLNDRRACASLDFVLREVAGALRTPKATQASRDEGFRVGFEYGQDVAIRDRCGTVAEVGLSEPLNHELERLLVSAATAPGILGVVGGPGSDPMSLGFDRGFEKPTIGWGLTHD
jgi:hypothetical protein